MKKSRICLSLVLLIGVGFAVCSVFFPVINSLVSWGVLAILLSVLIILAFFFQFESVALSSKEIALVSTLTAMSVVLRIPFSAVPSFQPCTFLILCTGYVFGPVAGFMVGAMTPLISNFLLGQGPWTLGQMLAWGMIGYFAAYLSRFKLSRRSLVSIGIIAAYGFGLLVNVYFWLYFAYPLTLNTLILAQLASFWFDAFHAIGNAVFFGLFGVKVIEILKRYKRRFTWKYS
ncbi:MAG: ECF transporter S component [Dehalococcoidia bacterium]|nr:ECF transporter S component [Dehalococcoidia bacterium]